MNAGGTFIFGSPLAGGAIVGGTVTGGAIAGGAIAGVPAPVPEPGTLALVLAALSAAAIFRGFRRRSKTACAVTCTSFACQPAAKVLLLLPRLLARGGDDPVDLRRAKREDRPLRDQAEARRAAVACAKIVEAQGRIERKRVIRGAKDRSS